MSSSAYEEHEIAALKEERKADSGRGIPVEAVVPFGQFALMRPGTGSSGPAAPHSKPYDPGECSEYNPDQRVLSGRR